MKLEISQELAQTLVNYLQTKPYVEVFQLINELLQLKKIESVKISSLPEIKEDKK